MPTEHPPAHCADEKTEAHKGQMTFSKLHHQVFWLQTRTPGFNYVFLLRGGSWAEWFNSTGIKERMGSLEELMKATGEWTGQVLPQTHRRL